MTKSDCCCFSIFIDRNVVKYSVRKREREPPASVVIFDRKTLLAEAARDTLFCYPIDEYTHFFAPNGNQTNCFVGIKKNPTRCVPHTLRSRGESVGNNKTKNAR